ncbi:MAG: leucine--tRNA ligase [Acidimicrobiaceae bacterium]|nr:leucine--tRNA ligase [Acidimicrobiaceae bacterium]
MGYRAQHVASLNPVNASSSAQGNEVDDSRPLFRYDAQLAERIETAWQERWAAQETYRVANPQASPEAENIGAEGRPKLFVMDMFPYPSGSGLHVGHPLGYIGTDVFSRYKRMKGFNVLHTMGYDAFGLPAEEHARQTGEHPRVNTETNIANMQRQLDRLGLGHDKQRSIATTDVSFYRWTQWIFLQIFQSWYDSASCRARPIAELEQLLASGERDTTSGQPWSEMGEIERRRELDEWRLAYLGEAPVNWCPALGTVLANEEVTAEGRSERGNHPVFRRPMKQWMMRITAYADRLLEDLETLDWTDSIKTMQRNWIGRSEGAEISFPTSAGSSIEVFTTRPDTLFGTTAMVLAPEHPLVDSLLPDSWPSGTPPVWTGGASTPREAVDDYRRAALELSDLERQENRSKTGVYLGAHCLVPVNNKQVPIFIADYVLMGYGTGAVMSVPGQDQRDWDFATAFEIDIVRTVEPPPGFSGEAYVENGPAINSGFLDGLYIDEAKQSIVKWLEDNGHGSGTVTYKLRDWLFSRQRYWGEPFPIVFDDTGLALAVPEDELPVELPELMDWAPRALDEESDPEPPLGRAEEWVTVDYDLGDGTRTYTRELNTMPQWAGSCWYYLRYLDPNNEERFVDPSVERYWMTSSEEGVGGVDLYVGGVEHAVLHLLYSRFWHKILYDLGHVSGPEPFQRLYNQGYIQAAAYQNDRGVYVDAEKVTEEGGTFLFEGVPVSRSFGKMGKSLRNSVTPDDMYSAYGADTLRLYEMFMGPLDQDRPWETKSVVGSHRLLQRVWRNLIDENTGLASVVDVAPPDSLKRLTHRTIAAVADAMEGLRFNSAIARITELNNELTKRSEPVPFEVARNLVLMLGPLVPHIAEELWEKLGNEGSIVHERFPEADGALLVEDSVELPVQVNGKVRSRVTVATNAENEVVEQAALTDDRINELLEGREVRKIIVVPDKLVNIVVS